MIAEPSKALFKTIAVGYAVGAAAFFMPLMLIFFVPSMAAQANIGLAKALGLIALVPVITIFQGMFFGAFVSLGLWVISKFRGARSV